jgi:hypothetical protein
MISRIWLRMGLLAPTAMSGQRVAGGRFDDRNAVVLSADAAPEAVPPVSPRTMATP